MTTGLLIRNFNKQSRELRYSNSGSIRFSEIEHNAYRLALTLEITHIDAPRYGSKKTLPDNTHYGYVTLFKGSTVTDTISIKYPKFRVFDIINQGIWNYHEHSEALQIGTLVSSESSEFAARGILEKIGGVADTTVCVVWRFLDFLGEDFVDRFVYNVFGCNDPNLPANGRELDKYRAFPIASPFPTVVKFKSDVPISFLWRLEAWFLVNPAVYIVDNPTDTGDDTDGEDEYPDPEFGDGDGDGSEFPASSAPDPNSDGRDYDPSQYDPDAPPWTPGDTVVIDTYAVADPGGCTDLAAIVNDSPVGLGGPPYSVKLGPLWHNNCSKPVYRGFIIVDGSGNEFPVRAGAGVYSASFVGYRII